MENVNPKKKSYAFAILLVMFLFSSAFWTVGLNINVYHWAVLGTIFEILWLPAVLFTIVVPVACLASWIRKRFSPKSRYLYLMLVSCALAYLVATSN